MKRDKGARGPPTRLCYLEIRSPFHDRQRHMVTAPAMRDRPVGALLKSRSAWRGHPCSARAGRVGILLAELLAGRACARGWTGEGAWKLPLNWEDRVVTTGLPDRVVP